MIGPSTAVEEMHRTQTALFCRWLHVGDSPHYLAIFAISKQTTCTVSHRNLWRVKLSPNHQNLAASMYSHAPAGASVFTTAHTHTGLCANNNDTCNQ